MNTQFIIPQIITTIRLLCAPLLFYAIKEEWKTFAFVLLFLIIITDLIDGQLARKYNVSTTFGGFYDATADFTVIMFAFSGFILKNIYPYWLLFLFILFFIFFIISSKVKKFVYDPIGKYYGAILFITIGVSIFYSKNPVPFVILILILVLTILTFISRLFTLKNKS